MPPRGYERKFADFIRMCETAKEKGLDAVVVAAPWVLGDTLEEMTESLTRLAKAGLCLAIAQPEKD